MVSLCVLTVLNNTFSFILSFFSIFIIVILLLKSKPLYYGYRNANKQPTETERMGHKEKETT